MTVNKLELPSPIYLLLCLLPQSLGLSTIQGGLGPALETFNHEGHVLGAFSEQVKSSLFYQSYVPLVLKFRVPDWRPEILRLNRSLVCAYDDMATNHLCPVAYHMDKIISPLSKAMRFYKNIFSASGGDFYEHNFSCDRIKPHFLHFSTNLGGMLPYLNEYRNRCPLGKNVSLTGKSGGVTLTQDAQVAFQKIHRLHKDMIGKNGNDSSSPDSPEWKFVEMAGYTAFQNSLLLSQYVESVRWGNAFTTCQSYKLDVGLVSPLLLNDSLTVLSKNLQANGYSFTLPFLSALPHYYKIPLVDCILTMSSSVFNVGWSGKMDWMARPSITGANATANLIIRLLIPVVKSGLNHKLIKLNKIPYLRKQKGVEKICEIINFHPDDIFLVEQNTTTGVDSVIGKVSPYCLTSKLCKVPEASHRQVVDPCVTGIITKNHDLTARNCYFDCFPIPNSQLAREKALPIFTQIASNKYAVTGLAVNSLPMLLLNCDGKTTHAFQPNTTEGAILITLPCNCKLVFGYKKYGSRKPCDETLDVEHVVEFGNHHHHQNGEGEEKDFIDYLIEALDSNAFNLTYSEGVPNGTVNGTGNGTGVGIGVTEKLTGGKGKVEEHELDQNHQQQYHCGHVVLWIFLITLLLLNSFTVFVLYKNRLISFNRLLFQGNSNNIVRFENDIPVTDLHLSG